MFKINYHNFNYEKDISLPNNLDEINKYIDTILSKSPSLNIVSNKELLDETINVARDYAKNKKNFIVFGTGGSNLASRALLNISFNVSKSKIDFYDNIDPIAFKNSLINIDIETTGFIIISKSGSTPETLSQFGSIVEIASERNLLNKFYKNCLFITEFKDSPLFNIAEKNNCLKLEHQKNIGGRYSVFSNVGMVPAIIGGLNVQDIHKGANFIVENLKEYNPYKLGQLFKYIISPKYTNSVIMTYSDSLYYFAKWYLQLWAESIGKNSKGITAIHSVGTTDQHSQLQLYLDGPKDKFFTFYTTNHKKKGFKLNNKIMSENKLEYLAQKTMGDLMQAEQQATIDTFIKNNFKCREVFLPSIDTFSMGSLMALSIVETIAACAYFEADPYTQPAVEEGKLLTIKYLS